MKLKKVGCIFWVQVLCWWLLLLFILYELFFLCKLGPPYTTYIRCHALWKISHWTCDEYHVWRRWYYINVERYEGYEYSKWIVANCKEKRRWTYYANCTLCFVVGRKRNFHTYHWRTKNTNWLFKYPLETDSYGHKQVKRIETTWLPCPYAANFTPLCMYFHD